MIVWQLCNCSQDDSVAWWISYMEGIYIYITQLHADELSNEQNLDFRPLRWMNEWIRTVQSWLLQLYMCKTNVDS
jgi:hypothetical protein